MGDEGVDSAGTMNILPGAANKVNLEIYRACDHHRKGFVAAIWFGYTEGNIFS